MMARDAAAQDLWALTAHKTECAQLREENAMLKLRTEDERRAMDVERCG
jgi:hypothetical protein